MKILTQELPTTLKICTFYQRSRPMFSGISKSKMEEDTLSTLTENVPIMPKKKCVSGHPTDRPSGPDSKVFKADVGKKKIICIPFNRPFFLKENKKF